MFSALYRRVMSGIYPIPGPCLATGRPHLYEEFKGFLTHVVLCALLLSCTMAMELMSSAFFFLLDSISYLLLGNRRPPNLETINNKHYGFMVCVGQESGCGWVQVSLAGLQSRHLLGWMSIQALSHDCCQDLVPCRLLD